MTKKKTTQMKVPMLSFHRKSIVNQFTFGTYISVSCDKSMSLSKPIMATTAECDAIDLKGVFPQFDANKLKCLVFYVVFFLMLKINNYLRSNISATFEIHLNSRYVFEMRIHIGSLCQNSYTNAV